MTTAPSFLPREPPAPLSEPDEPPTWTEKPRRDGKPHGQWKPCPGFEPAENMDKWYDAGRPLFPREELQEIHDQLRRPLPNGSLIFVKGFDGQWYEYIVRTGDYQEYKGKTYRLGRPQISYKDFETLKEKVDAKRNPIYCPISIVHGTRPEIRRADFIEGITHGRQMIDAAMDHWETHQTFLKVQLTLLMMSLQRKVTKVIGLACGPFVGGSNPKAGQRSAIQHAMLMLIRRLLRASHLGAGEVPCYVQDPAYAPADRMVLAENSVETVQDPEGFLNMDDSSLVFCCEPTTCVKSIVADVARPLIIIWNTVITTPPYLNAETSDPDCPRVQAMMQEYDVFDFPEDENFGDLKIYVRSSARNTPR
ncbi:hypothetical protein BJY00DRAFT_298935 [Aspergillus carlsbadensis]|nr:hypothetical protein BJY00DRAFT_298935 [Aspergillus carlsbadensis]